MDDLKGRLIEAVVRPFAGDPELQLAASQLLGEQVRPDGRGAEQAIARWNEVDARTRRPWGWNRLLFWVLICLSVAIWVPTLLGHFEFVRLVKSITSDDKPSIESVVLKRFGNRLSASQKLVLLGDCSKSTQVEKMKALWDSQSGNPVYFSEYARVYLKKTKQLPPNFLEVARLIDPENAWFTYLAAAVEAEGGYEKNLRQEHKERRRTAAMEDSKRGEARKSRCTSARGTQSTALPRLPCGNRAGEDPSISSEQSDR